MLTNGDKLMVIKDVAHFLKEGDIVEVVNVTDNGIISFAFGDNLMHMGMMSNDECAVHFKKIEEEEEKTAPTITQEYIDEIMENSEFVVNTVFDKCTVVACRLPNGFVIVESSACVSPENYDKDKGVEVCIEKIENKIWELEGYRLQQWMYENTCCCNECCDECCCDEDEDEFDECLDTDLDCFDCDDYSCEFNPNR
jgi:hypothetical protein